ncbi:MAG: NIPSNAP family protein [Candidatus Thorarchaeota archaeon]
MFISVIKMAIYMLYRQKAKDEKRGELDELREEFEGIYKKYKVDILGFWENADDPNEVYYISKYEDESDYRSKTEQLRSDERYAELSKKLEEVRLDFEAFKLNPLWTSE